LGLVPGQVVPRPLIKKKTNKARTDETRLGPRNPRGDRLCPFPGPSKLIGAPRLSTIIAERRGWLRFPRAPVLGRWHVAARQPQRSPLRASKRFERERSPSTPDHPGILRGYCSAIVASMRNGAPPRPPCGPAPKKKPPNLLLPHLANNTTTPGKSLFPKRTRSPPWTVPRTSGRIRGPPWSGGTFVFEPATLLCHPQQVR